MYKFSFLLIFLILSSCASVPENPAATAANANKKTVPPETGEEPVPFSQAPSLIAGKLMKRMPKQESVRAGVLDFKNLKGEESPDGKLLAEKLISELTAMEGITVVERQHLAGIIKEQKLNMSGITTETGQEAGTVLSIDVLISGTIASVNGKNEITARITDVKTGEIHGAVTLKTKADTHVETPPGRNREAVRFPETYPAGKTERQGWRVEKGGFVTPEIRSELSALKRRDPGEFHKAKKFLNSLKKMKERRPALFVLVTEPPGSKKLLRLEKNNPRMFRKLRKTRMRLLHTLRLIPSLKPKLHQFRRAASARTGRRRMR